MSSFRDKFYMASGYAAGFCIALIMVIILMQIVGRIFGFIVPSAEDVSGYALAASTFFGLAYTFHEGGHIRVTLVIQKWGPKARFIQELAVLIFGLGLACYMTFYCWHMVYESYIFEEVSHGYIPIPIWIPQIPVGLGMTALAIALLDDLVAVLRQRTPSYQQHESDINLEEI
ncbi:TRAP transporter small permease [Marinobacter qingdaonensis]|jgi:TRAP-type C4-dicarboxylate transport system permease small subunit|uniref:TRAP transporter small permease protein n=1 Tax=Marinobacter qingdaonensis TaxID=3108486 RepID=A0ABU5NZB7_9GAMM|nr:TRAP transporter small permease [Marinobacter sp. ASW11-75]MEA1081140.1 TRAP transporter small permease [Marinobacter sp. ASW11-75]MEE2764835.1 TRAP transporter small permease [Pseudomonadota bacterium]